MDLDLITMLDNTKNLQATYKAIITKFPQFVVEPFSVVENVMKHRFYWKPVKTRIILLAESHVFTTLEETTLELNYTADLQLADCPSNFKT